MSHTVPSILRGIALVTLFALSNIAPASAATRDSVAIAQFNERFAAATRAMQDSAVLALWDENGISLLPSQAPIVGKPALAAFLARVRTQYPDAKMRSFECHCHDIQISGDIAAEWCDEHQIVDLPDHKIFDGRGKMLLVLHRGAGGTWRLSREMWNQGEAQ
jgi:ketosteroid isomerase-like protein